MSPLFANDFGEYLVNRRRAAGWSQEELAERSTVSVRTIRNLETGSIKSPRKSSVHLLLEAFGSTVTAGHAGAPSRPAWTGQRADPPNPAAGAEWDAAARPRWRGTRGDPEPIVGRRADLDHIRDSMRHERRIVLTGPGGVGKTRLALAAAAQLRAEYPDGVAVVEAGTLPPERTDPGRDLECLRRAVLAAVGPSDGPGEDRLPDDSRMLLVIDNAEHLTNATTLLSQQIMDVCPGLHLIVTSRRPMAAASAPVWEVGPLSVGDGSERSEAVELFLRRVQSACPTLDLANRLDAVRELCAKLDGMPLALELAALRLRSVPLDKLLQDGPISQMLGQAGSADLPHHRTLANSVRWSYDLLTEEQRALLHRLAGFPGAFTIEDVERLHRCSAARSADVVGHLAELVDSSLVHVQRGPRYSYRLLGYVREFVLSRLSTLPSQSPNQRFPQGGAAPARLAASHKSNVLACENSTCPRKILTVPLDGRNQPGRARDAGSPPSHS